MPIGEIEPARAGVVGEVGVAVFVFGVCIESQDSYDRHCLPAIAAIGGPDATLATTTDTPVATTYNQILDASREMSDVEAVVLLRDDTELVEPRFRPVVRSAFEADPHLGLIASPAIDDGPAAPPPCLVFSPEAARSLRFDDRTHRDSHGFESDLVRRARELGFSVEFRALGVVRHGHPGADPARGATLRDAIVTQGVRARRLGDLALARVLDPATEAAAHRPAEDQYEGRAATPVAPEGFYLFSHPEILEHLPRSARRVLDVACGAGTRGATIKEELGAEVVGIELGDAAATLAEERLDDVWRIDLATAHELPAAEGSFDVIVAVDVLERLVDPDAALRLLARYLAPTGRFIATVPNVRHWSVVMPLILEDRWELTSGGPLHHAALRHFTMTETAALFRSAGLGRFEACAANQIPPDEPDHLDPLLACIASYGADAEEARTLLNSYQFVVVAMRES